MRPTSGRQDRLRARGAAHVTTMARGEEGQAIIIIALSALVLFGVLALVIDFGYGLTQRRVMVNAAESVALASGKLLATHVAQIRGEIRFTVKSTQVLANARAFRDLNKSFVAPAGSYKLELWYGNKDAPTTDNWTLAVDLVDQDVPIDTVYVRTASSVKYRSFIAGILGFPQMEAAGTARVRLSGSDAPLSTPIWPMVRHYNPADFDNTTCTEPCTNLPPVTFWSSNAPDMVYGSMKGLANFSRYSTVEKGKVPQLITKPDDRAIQPDISGNKTSSGNCDSKGWDPSGNNNRLCDIPNWFYYGFGGRVELTANWQKPPDKSQDAPSPLGNRPGVCAGANRPPLAPSCTDPNMGDWVEVDNGNTAINQSAPMQMLFESEGKLDEVHSDKFVPGSTKVKYGRYIVRLVYMWDCAETYGKDWKLIPGGSDCSQITGSPQIDRVHLFTVAPFIFYEGLSDPQQIGGFWGVGFGDASSCTICPSALNTFSNTAYIIPDD